jgi:acetyl-CoA acetyltransferase
MGPRNFTMNNYFKEPFPESPARTPRRISGDVGCRSEGRGRRAALRRLHAARPGVAEEYGFCKPGEAGAFVEDGGLEVGGRLPNNTSGGSLSEAYVHGINLIIEAVRQIRGISVNQVPNARLSMATSGNMVPTGAILLRGDR